ncbi:MAG: serine/threonine protein kinase [Sandaracinaceae bacterium]
MTTVSISTSHFDSGNHSIELTPIESPLGRFGADYVLLREIAAGGMGRIYLAREVGPGGFSRYVALKCIHDHLADQRPFVKMFLDEARIVSRIQHAQVCSVYDFGEVDDVYYIAMEFLRGQPFSEVLRELGRSPPGRSSDRFAQGAFLLAQACEGLHAAHDLRDDAGALLNVVHRDVSPHNLFVTYDGSMRVLDFGVARARGRLADSTTGRVKGKLAYMAPEQAMGKSVDRRGDVFALGVCLWELLTLQRLFRKDNPGETVLAVIQKTPDRPSSLVPGVPKALEDVAMRALQRDPDARYQTAREMGRDLTRALGSMGVALSAPDVTDWMDGLFPGMREASHDLLLSADAAMENVSELTPTHTRATTRSVSPRKRGALPFMIVGGAVLGAAMAVGGMWGFLSREEPTATLPSVSEVPPQAAAVPDLEREAAPTDPSDVDMVIDEPPEAPVEATPEPAPPAARRPRPGRNRPRPPVTAPRPRPARGGTGQVRLSGPSELWGARVFHRGQMVGSVPGTVRLPAGRQRVDIVIPGQARRRETVNVPANGVARLVLR